MRLTVPIQTLIDHYKTARDWIHGSPYLAEVRWQEAQSFNKINESTFLSEYAWVVLNSGFKEAVIRKHFNFISLCFCDWESAKIISQNSSACIEAALSVFNNRRKFEAIATTAKLIAERGFGDFYNQLSDNPANALQALPFIGSVTSLHLAKNLGVDVAKPDRHLVKLAARFGYDDVNTMCRDISEAVGDKISVADLVLWRFEERSLSYSSR